MLIGYVRVSKSDGSQLSNLQIDAIRNAGAEKIYEDKCSGKSQDRIELEACKKALRKGDTLIIWRLDRLGRDIRHLIEVVTELRELGVGLRVLNGIGDQEIDTSSANGQFIFHLFASLAEFERKLLIERTRAGLESARARGRTGGAPRCLSKTRLLMASASMEKNCNVKMLCKDLKISRATLYRYVRPNGALTDFGKKVLEGK